MLRVRKAALMLMLLVGAVAAQAAEKMRFVLSNFPPYAYEEHGKIIGLGVQRVEKILHNAGIDYELSLVPNFGRVLQNLKEGKSDGFFLASRNAERDAVATLTLPVLLNRWVWVVPSGSKLDPGSSEFKTQARLGTHMHSNTHVWLLQHGYTVTGAPSNISNLLVMLKMDRINAILLSELVFNEALMRAGQPIDGYSRMLHSEHHFGIYIAKTYLASHPGVLERINDEIRKAAL
ncbi:MAG: substrate-binding periplasmic protein [Sphingomonadaceae bacterium]